MHKTKVLQTSISHNERLGKTGHDYEKVTQDKIKQDKINAGQVKKRNAEQLQSR